MLRPIHLIKNTVTSTTLPGLLRGLQSGKIRLHLFIIFTTLANMLKQRSTTAIHYLVIDPNTLAPSRNQTVVTQIGQVARDHTLGQLQRLHQITDTQFTRFQQQVDDPQPHRLGKGFEQRGK